MCTVHRVTQGLLFTQSETAEIRLTFCIETTNPGIQVSCIHTSEYIATVNCQLQHDDVIKWKHFPRYWPFVRGIHRSPVNSPHKGQWRRALTFSLTCAWINSWVNNHESGDLRCHRIHYDVTVMNEWRVEHELPCGRSQDYETV